MPQILQPKPNTYWINQSNSNYIKYFLNKSFDCIILEDCLPPNMEEALAYIARKDAWDLWKTQGEDPNLTEFNKIKNHISVGLNLLDPDKKNIIIPIFNAINAYTPTEAEEYGAMEVINHPINLANDKKITDIATILYDINHPTDLTDDKKAEILKILEIKPTD